MIDTQYSIIASASRNRTTLAANRDEVADRAARDKLSFNAFDESQRRKEIIEESIARQERAIQLRRNDLEETFEVARARNEQVRYAETVANDTAFQNRRADIASEVNDQRADRAAVYDITLSEYDESLALDQIESEVAQAPLTETANPAPTFGAFLADRENRNAERAQIERDRNIQQQIDLQVAENNLRSIPQGSDLPRGALVDVLG